LENHVSFTFICTWIFLKQNYSCLHRLLENNEILWKAACRTLVVRSPAFATLGFLFSGAQSPRDCARDLVQQNHVILVHGGHFYVVCLDDFHVGKLSGVDQDQRILWCILNSSIGISRTNADQFFLQLFKRFYGPQNPIINYCLGLVLFWFWFNLSLLDLSTCMCGNDVV